VFVRSKRLKHASPLLLWQTTQVKFVVISQKNPPLCRCRPRFGRFQRFDQWARIGGGQCIKEILIDLKIEHHVHAIAVFAEVIHVGFGQDVGFRQHNAVALPPLEEFAKHAQHIELLLWFSHGWSLGPDDERHRVHTKSGHARLDPKPHDFEYLSLHFRI
jgi:hypothetical protein